MSTLNIVNKSPYEKRTLDQCLARITAGDAVLLIEDAVVVATAGTSYENELQQIGGDKKLFVLTPDLEARGLADRSLVAGFSAIDYQGFVALVTEHDRVHSWL
jgi:tRNA 2-thiouridine synthesizing protein B